MSIHNSIFNRPHSYHFSSSNHISGSNSSFVSKPISLPINEYDTVAVVQTSIPRSAYNVPSGANSFTLIENAVEKTVSLTPGNYTKSVLISKLVSALNDAGSFTYNITYPSGTNVDTFHLTFNVSGNTGSQPSFKFGIFMYRQLGFDKNSTYTFDSNTISSVNCIDLSAINRVFIYSNITSENEGLLESVLSYGSNPALSIAYHYNSNIDIVSKKYENTSKNSWTFTLKDEDGLELDLNGIPWHFDLIFYKRNSSHEIQETHTKMLMEQEMFKISTEIETLEKDLNEKDTKKDDDVEDDVEDVQDTRGLKEGQKETLFGVEDVFADEEKVFKYPNDYSENVKAFDDDRVNPRLFSEPIIEEEDGEDDDVDGDDDGDDE